MLNVMSNCYYTFSFSPGTSVAVSSILFALVLVGRAAFVFPISNITNCMKKRESTKIELRQQVIPAGA
jgi:sodium/hydrogen exchanger 8